jgi:superfamily II DNA or RNA helicase
MKIHVLLGFEPAFGEAVPGPDESSLPRPSSSLNTLSFSNGQLLVALEKLLDQKLPPLLATCLPRPKVAQSSSNAAVSYDRRDALKLYTGDPNASFNSLEQAISLDTALKRDENALIIIPTGGGKSVVFMIPPLYYESEVTVVVLPLVALTHDMVRRAQDINLPTCCWAYNNVDPSSRLVFISVEQAGSDAFLVWGVKLAEDGKLARIAVDECHNALTALDYRPCMANLSKLRSLKVQILLLSATVPPVMEERLLEALNIQNVRIIRAATNRAEIRYIIHRTPESQLSKQISHTIADLSDRLLKTPRDRGICFSTSIHHCEELAAAYSELSYHGQAPSDQRESVVQLWRSGNAPIIKATSAFGEGVDYGPIRFVINCCAPKNAVEFVQQSGRCARDGQLAEAHLFLSPPNDHDVPMSEPRSDLFGQKVISELETSSECIRTILSRFMDGKTVSCGSLPKAELCSNCEKMQNSMFPPATARVHRRSASEDSALVAMFEKRKKLDPDAASRVSAPKPLARLTRPMASIQPAQSALLHPDAPPPRNQHPGPAILMDHAYHTVNQRQRGEKEAQLSRALNIIQDYCSICWIVTRQLESHQQCPNVDLSGYAEVQHRLVFILRQVCWHCFLPLGIELHPDNIARAEDCRFRNVVGPAVYAIWKIIPLRAQMEAHFNCAGEIDGWEQFAMWLSRRERTYSNLIEVFIWASSLQL